MQPDGSIKKSQVLCSKTSARACTRENSSRQRDESEYAFWTSKHILSLLRSRVLTFDRKTLFTHLVAWVRLEIFILRAGQVLYDWQHSISPWFDTSPLTFSTSPVIQNEGQIKLAALKWALQLATVISYPSIQSPVLCHISQASWSQTPRLHGVSPS